MSTIPVALLGLSLMAGSVGCSGDNEKALHKTELNVPSSVKTLVSTVKDASTHSLVFLHDVKLEPAGDRHAWYAVGKSGAKVLVVTNEPADVKPGSVTDVFGRIEALPSMKVARSRWNLAAKSTLESERFYIAAQKLGSS